jgi:hypothetical protein
VHPGTISALYASLSLLKELGLVPHYAIVILFLTIFQGIVCKLALGAMSLSLAVGDRCVTGDQ